VEVQFDNNITGNFTV